MSEHSNHRGKRQAAGKSSGLAGCWASYQNWLSGLTKGQRIRYRVLETVTILSLLIIVAFFALRGWVRVPDLPGPGGTAALPDVSFGQSQSHGEAKGGQREGVYTFLLVGKDTAGGGNTDTMLLLTYDTKEKTISGLNLPRDTMVNVSTRSKRLNAVYNYNKGKDKDTQVEKGMAALKQQVSYLTSIEPNFYVIVEWEAIGELVDALGGVEFEVPFDMDYDDPTPGQELYIHQKAGLRLLSGEDAMQVIRHRKNNDGSHSNGDVGRLKVQQDFLKAVAKTCLQPATFLKIPALAEIFSKNVTTDLTLGNILAFAELAYGMDPEKDVNFATAPIGDSFTYQGAALITLDQDGLLELLNERMNPYEDPIRAEDLQLVYRQKNGSIAVTNGTLADGMGSQSGGGTNTKAPEKQEQPAAPSVPPAPTQPEEPEQPDDVGEVPEVPEQIGDGDTSQEPERPTEDVPQEEQPAGEDETTESGEYTEETQGDVEEQPVQQNGDDQEISQDVKTQDGSGENAA